MLLDQPWELIGSTCDLCKQICGHLSPASSVSSIFALFSKSANALESVSKWSLPSVISMGFWLKFDFGQYPSGSLVCSTENRNSHGDHVGMVFDFCCNLIKKLVNAMKFIPFRFQCPCFACDFKSIESASLAFSISVTASLVFRLMSIFVLCVISSFLLFRSTGILIASNVKTGALPLRVTSFPYSDTLGRFPAI